jgi:hypothetical protein
MKKKSKNPYSKQYPNGGFSWNNLGHLAKNTGLGIADAGLSSVGLNNVITNGDYQGYGKNLGQGTANVGGTVGKFALPLAANAIVPGSGAFVAAGQKALGQVNDQYITKYDQYGNPIMANGGYVPQANAELEKQENVRYPNGTTDQFNGPSHENGGIQTNLPNMTQVFSDKLKASSGKTFAKEAAKFNTEKETKILEDDKKDKLAKFTAKLMFDKKNQELNKLFSEQEQLKFNKVQKYAAKNGVNINGGKYPNGGFVDNTGISGYDQIQEQPVVNNLAPIAPINPYPVPQQDNTFINTPMPDLNDPQYKPKTFANGGLNEDGSIDYTDAFNKAYNGLNSQAFGQPIAPIDAGSIYKATSPTDPMNIAGNAVNAYNNINLPNNDIGKQIGMGLVQNAGNLAYLAQQGKKYDKVNYGNITPSYLSSDAALRDVNTSTANTAKAIPSLTGGHGGAAINALIQNKTQGDINKSRVREEFGNVNAQITNQTNQFNKQNQIRGMNDEAANKGQALTNYYSAIGGIGQNIGSQTKDYNLGQVEKTKLKLINNYFPNYKYDPKTADFYYKLASNR